MGKMINKRLFFSLLLVGCVLAAMTRLVESVASAQGTPREIEVVAKRYEFVPDKITLTKGEVVTLKLTTEDVAHSLYVRDLKINETVEPGQVAKITIQPEAEGTYRGSCQKFCGEEHAKMKFTIVVE